MHYRLNSIKYKVYSITISKSQFLILNEISNIKFLCHFELVEESHRSVSDKQSMKYSMFK